MNLYLFAVKVFPDEKLLKKNEELQKVKNLNEAQEILLEPTAKNIPNLTKPVEKKDNVYEEKQGPVVEPVQPDDSVDSKLELQNKEKLQHQIRDSIAEVKKDPAIPGEENNVEKNPILEPPANDQHSNQLQDNIALDGNKKNLLQEAADNIKVVKKEIEEKHTVNVDEQTPKIENSKPQSNIEDGKNGDNNKILIDTIQKQNEVQREIVEQQKKLIEVIQRQQLETGNNDVVNEEKVKAVKEIKNMAMKAIESISGQDTKKVEKGPNNTIIKNSNPEVQNIQNVAIRAIETISGKVNNQQKPEVRNLENIDKKDVKNEVQMKNQQKPEVRNIDKKDVKDEVKATNVTNYEQNNKTLIKDKLLSPVVEDAKLNIKESVNLVPLPIALAQINNVSQEKPLNKKHKNDEAQAMRRDILSERRVKRDTNRVEKLNKAVKEVCNENLKTSTERPLIKMLCKLSDGDIAQLDTEVLKKLEISNLPPVDSLS